MSKEADSPHRPGAPEAPAMRPARDVIARRVDTGTILIHLRTNRIYELNGTGARIWELLAQGRTAADMRSLLQQEFDVGDTEAARAIEDTFAMLSREGLIEPDEAT